MNTLAKSLILISTVSLFVSQCYAAKVDHIDCSSKFKVNPEQKKLAVECAEKSGMTAPKSGDKPMTREDYVKSSYDDKCVGKCVLEKMKLLKDGKFDREAFTADIKANVEDLAFQKTVIEYTMKAIDATEALAKSEGGLEKNMCKYVSFYFFTLSEEALKVTC